MVPQRRQEHAFLKSAPMLAPGHLSPTPNSFTFHREWPWGRGSDADPGRWCGARFWPQPLQNLRKNIIFSNPPMGSALALWGTHARARITFSNTFPMAFVGV